MLTARNRLVSAFQEQFLVETDAQRQCLPSQDSGSAVSALLKLGQQGGIDDLIARVFAGEWSRRLRALELEVTAEEAKALFTAMDTDGAVSRLDLMQVMKPKPRVAWAEQSPEPAPTDLSSQLLAAQSRIKSLESALKQRDIQPSNASSEAQVASKAASLETELAQMQSRFERMREENERLKLDKGRLETHIERTPAAPGTADFIALQRKIEMLEDSHYRREQMIKSQLDSLALKDQEMQQLRHKHATEVTSFQRLLASKAAEIDGFKSELEQILGEVARIQQRRN